MRGPAREYIGAGVIARELGVTRAAVTNWKNRGIPGMPAPAAVIRHEKKRDYVWLPSSLPAWKEWHEGWKQQTAGFQLARAEANLVKAREQPETARREIRRDR